MLRLRGYWAVAKFNTELGQTIEEKGDPFFEISFEGNAKIGTVSFFEVSSKLSPRRAERVDFWKTSLLQALDKPFLETVYEPPLSDGKTIIRGHRSHRHEPWTIASVCDAARNAAPVLIEWIVPPPPEYYEGRRKSYESQPKADPDLDRRVREAEAYQRKAVEEIARTGIPSDDTFLPTVKQAREMMVLRAKAQGIEPPVYPELPESSPPVDDQAPRRRVSRIGNRPTPES